MSTLPPPLPASEQRLHPLSWLFLTVSTLRGFALPLIALLVFGNRLSDRWTMVQLLLPLLAVGAVIASTLITQMTTRYSIGARQLSVRSGWLERQWREIPFSRIHNVSLRQNLLHRLFDVAELKLESAGSPKPEADMKVLPYARALALEQLIRQYGKQTTASPLENESNVAAAPDTPPATEATTHLLRLSIADLVRMGLLSNRGLLVMLAALGAIRQLIPDDTVEQTIREQADHWVDEGQRQSMQLLSLPEWLGIGLVALMGLMLLTRLLSVALAVLQYYGFELRQQGDRLTQERGLFSRQRASVGRHRIQSWTIRQPVLYRWFGQAQIRVDIASGAAGAKEALGFRELVPIVARARGDALLQDLAPRLQWPITRWQAIGRRHWWRLMVPALIILPLACLAAQHRFGAMAWWALLLLLPLAWRNWRAIGFAAWHRDATAIAVRGGAWGQWWRLSELSKLQAVSLHRSPLDRLCGTASLHLDTAGRSRSAPGLAIHYLPVAQARNLLDELCTCLSRPRPAPPSAGMAPDAIQSNWSTIEDSRPSA